MPACGDVCTHMYPRRVAMRRDAMRQFAHGSSVSARSLLGRCFTFRSRHSGRPLLLSPRADKERDGKGSVERSARAWPLVSNQSRSAGSSSIRGLRLHLPTRPRLAQTRAPGDKPSLNPRQAHMSTLSHAETSSMLFLTDTQPFFAILSSVLPQKRNRPLPSPALYHH